MTQHHRLNMSTSPSVRKLLERAMVRQDTTSYSEASKNVLNFCSVLIDDLERGGEIVIKTPDGQMTTWIVPQFYLPDSRR